MIPHAAEHSTLASRQNLTEPFENMVFILAHTVSLVRSVFLSKGMEMFVNLREAQVRRMSGCSDFVRNEVVQKVGVDPISNVSLFERQIFVACCQRRKCPRQIVCTDVDTRSIFNELVCIIKPQGQPVGSVSSLIGES